MTVTSEVTVTSQWLIFMNSTNSQKNYNVPDGTMKRLAWRPSEMGSFISNIGRHVTNSQDIESRLTSWHGQLSSRIQPWIKSSSPSNRFNRNENVSKFNLPVNPEYVFVTQENDFMTENLEMNKDNNQTPVLEPPVGQHFSRPKMNLAVLGDNRIENDMVQDNSSGQIKRDFFAPRIQISAAISPRHEDRDRFVNYNIAIPQKSGNSEDSYKNKEAQDLEYQNSAPISDRSIEKKLPDESNHVIEKLIQQTDVPISLPGLNFKLINSPKELVQQKESEKKERENDSALSDRMSQQRAFMQPPAPKIDVDSICDKVIQKLHHYQKIERERRGLI